MYSGTGIANTPKVRRWDSFARAYRQRMLHAISVGKYLISRGRSSNANAAYQVFSETEKRRKRRGFFNRDRRDSDRVSGQECAGVAVV